MKQQSLRDRFAKALELLGETNSPWASRKFLRFTRREGGFYFIGKSGSLRHGQTLTGSVPISDAFKAKLLVDVGPLS